MPRYPIPLYFKIDFYIQFEIVVYRKESVNNENLDMVHVHKQLNLFHIRGAWKLDKINSRAAKYDAVPELGRVIYFIRADTGGPDGRYLRLRKIAVIASF